MPEEPKPTERPAPKPAAAVATLPKAPPGGGPQWQQQVQAPPLHGPWPAVSVWGRRWPGPGRPASAATVGAVSGAAVVAALSLPLDRAGLGWLVAAFAGVIALAVAWRLAGPARGLASGLPPALPSWQPERVARRRLGAQRYFWSTATVALLGVGTVRAAGWLFLLCLVTAVWTAALAVAGGRSLRGMLVALQMALVAPFRAIPWAVRGAGAIRRRRTGGSAGARVVATIAISVALLLVFGGLFASADAAFAELLSQALPDLNVGTAVRWIFVFVVTGLMLAGAAYLRAAPPDLSGLDGRGTRRVARFEWAVPLGLLVALFAAFVGVQLTVLFGDSSHVLKTAGLTYADYARSGFWQLAVVTVLTLVVLALAARWAPRDTSSDRTLIRVLLGSLAGLTLVIVASSLHRMNLYSDTYGLTRLRVLVAASELWLGAVFVLLLVAGLKLRGDWVPRVAMGLGVLALLGLAGANPDGLIADRNITRYEQLKRIDMDYLAGLSADAVPALERLPQVQRDCVLREVGDFRQDPDDWRGWNYGRQHAQDLLAAHPIGASSTCSYAYR